MNWATIFCFLLEISRAFQLKDIFVHEYMPTLLSPNNPAVLDNGVFDTPQGREAHDHCALKCLKNESCRGFQISHSWNQPTIWLLKFTCQLLSSVPDRYVSREGYLLVQGQKYIQQFKLSQNTHRDSLSESLDLSQLFENISSEQFTVVAQNEEEALSNPFEIEISDHDQCAKACLDRDDCNAFQLSRDPIQLHANPWLSLSHCTLLSEIPRYLTEEEHKFEHANAYLFTYIQQFMLTSDAFRTKNIPTLYSSQSTVELPESISVPTSPKFYLDDSISDGETSSLGLSSDSENDSVKYVTYRLSSPDATRNVKHSLISREKSHVSRMPSRHDLEPILTKKRTFSLDSRYTDLFPSKEIPMSTKETNIAVGQSELLNRDPFSHDSPHAKQTQNQHKNTTTNKQSGLPTTSLKSLSTSENKRENTVLWSEVVTSRIAPPKSLQPKDYSVLPLQDVSNESTNSARLSVPKVSSKNDSFNRARSSGEPVPLVKQHQSLSVEFNANSSTKIKPPVQSFKNSMKCSLTKKILVAELCSVDDSSRSNEESTISKNPISSPVSRCQTSKKSQKTLSKDKKYSKKSKKDDENDTNLDGFLESYVKSLKTLEDITNPKDLRKIKIPKAPFFSREFTNLYSTLSNPRDRIPTQLLDLFARILYSQGSRSVREKYLFLDARELAIGFDKYEKHGTGPHFMSTDFLGKNVTPDSLLFFWTSNNETQDQPIFFVKMDMKTSLVSVSGTEKSTAYFYNHILVLQECFVIIRRNSGFLNLSNFTQLEFQYRIIDHEKMVELGLDSNVFLAGEIKLALQSLDPSEKCSFYEKPVEFLYRMKREMAEALAKTKLKL